MIGTSATATPSQRSRGSLYGVLAVVGALALAGWIWSVSNFDIPDALWLLTVLLTILFVVLLAYVLFRRPARSG